MRPRKSAVVALSLFLAVAALLLVLGAPTGNDGLTSNGGGIYPVVSSAQIVGGIDLNPQSIVSLNGVAYFAGTSSESGTELWRSDGTEAGTYVLKDIVVGSGSSNPRQLITFGGNLFFVVDHSLWVSDGTEAGTVSVYTTQLAVPISELIKSDNFLYFISGNKIYISDGTNFGTSLVSVVTNARGLIPDGASGAFLRAQIACSAGLFSCWRPWRVQPGLWPSSSIGLQVSQITNSDTFSMPGSETDQPFTNLWAGEYSNLYFEVPYGLNSGYYFATGNTPVLRTAAQLPTGGFTPGYLNYSYEWNGSGYSPKIKRFFEVGAHRYGFDTRECELNMSSGVITAVRNLPRNLCGVAIPQGVRLIGGEYYYVSPAATCSAGTVGGSVFNISTIDGSLSYVTDISEGGGPSGKYKGYFNALLNGGRISAVEAGNRIFFNNAGSLEVTTLVDDQCIGSPVKTAPGICGCDVPDTDENNDGIIDCLVPPTPTSTPTTTPTVTPTQAPTAIPTFTATTTPTATNTATPTATEVITETVTPTPSVTETPLLTPPPTETPTETYSETPTPTSTPSVTRSPTPTQIETPTSLPTELPTATPTAKLPPDLAIAISSVPKALVVNKAGIVTVRVTNIGGDIQLKNFKVSVYISVDQKFNAAKDRRIGATTLKPIPAGASVVTSIKVVTSVAPRRYNIFVVADSGHAVPEINRSNNTALAAGLVNVKGASPKK